MLAENTFEFMDYHLMKKGKLYIKDSGDFINKIKNLQNISDDAMLVTDDVLRLSPHDFGLRALKEALNNRESTTIPSENLLKCGSSQLKIIILSSTEKLSISLSIRYCSRDQVHSYIRLYPYGQV